MMHKIAYLCGTKAWGGLEMNQVRNAEWMRDRGHTVVVFCLKDSPVYNAAILKNLSILIIKQHRHHYDFFNAFMLLNALKALKIEHLFFRATFDMSIAASIRFLSRGRIKTHYFMEMAFEKNKRHFFRTWRYSFFDSWICPLAYLKEQVLINSNFPEKKILVIPSGIDLKEFKPTNKVEAREKLGLPSERKIIGLIGRFESKKGQMLALEAMKYVTTDFLLLLVGEETLDQKSNYLNELKQYTREQKLEDKVQFLNFTQSPADVFNAIDWTLMASYSETFGMVTLESMACGTAVIGSNTGGTKSLLNEGGLGVFFETKNPQDLAEKLNNALSSNLKFSEKELVNFAKEFDHNLVCEKIENIIN
ncbi:MAG: glycosyltransferase family 1 protein [Flavobacteriia bacterium]|nr:glycosyltransferase family 1 protein [Flavobacteriia bacterium]